VHFSNYDKYSLEIKEGESVSVLADSLRDQGLIGNIWLFKKYLSFTGMDKKINAGSFELKAPITMASIAKVLSAPGLNEVTITILPGWNLRQVADYLASQGFAKSSQEVFEITGYPAKIVSIGPGKKVEPPLLDEELEVESSKPLGMSYEGYFAPETYRVYKNSLVKDILRKMLVQHFKEVSFDIVDKAAENSRIWKLVSKNRGPDHEILTMASILEKEARTPEDRRIIADILWRRVEVNWALQVDSSVHYAVDKTGDVFTTENERGFDSLWNTYKYPGLPPGPICNPGFDSILAAVEPVANEYWYFLSGADGKMHYAKTLEEHNLNKQKYL